MMLQQSEPDDYVIATDKPPCEVLSNCCATRRYGYKWQGNAEDEVGIDQNTGKTIIKVVIEYYRRQKSKPCFFDPSKARETLGWEPKINLSPLLKR